MGYSHTFSHLIGALVPRLSISRLQSGSKLRYTYLTFHDQVFRVMGEFERPPKGTSESMQTLSMAERLVSLFHLHHTNISHSFLVKEVCTSTFYHWVFFESTD